VPLEDAREVSRYVAALEHGLQRLRGGFPLSHRLLREVHAVLMATTGTGPDAGRVSQQSGLDRRHAAGQRGVRAASSQRNR
jgi:Fic family protein